MAMVRLTDIVEKVRSYHPAADVDLINKAYVYSAKAHDGQMRKSGDPYFIHPVSVAHIIADMRLDPASVCAALNASPAGTHRLARPIAIASSGPTSRPVRIRSMA